MKILVINGPNLNLLGSREVEIYGTVTLEDITNILKGVAGELGGVELEFFQSNHEGEIVDAVQNAVKSGVDGIIINPAAYTHTSLAIADALAAVSIPAVEVHLSNVQAREEARRRSFCAPKCIGQICGFGANSYKLGLLAIVEYVKRKK